MLLALVADLFLYALLLSPVVTLTVSGIVLTVTCSRFLSSKLADNIQQTKVNTDDIKNLQSNKENES